MSAPGPNKAICSRFFRMHHIWSEHHGVLACLCLRKLGGQCTEAVAADVLPRKPHKPDQTHGIVAVSPPYTRNTAAVLKYARNFPLILNTCDCLKFRAFGPAQNSGIRLRTAQHPPRGGPTNSKASRLCTKVFRLQVLPLYGVRETCKRAERQQKQTFLKRFLTHFGCASVCGPASNSSRRLQAQNPLRPLLLHCHGFMDSSARTWPAPAASQMSSGSSFAEIKLEFTMRTLRPGQPGVLIIKAALQWAVLEDDQACRDCLKMCARPP